jgi:hypothetical protein
MPCWQYAQLTITVDGRTSRENSRAIMWQGPGQGLGESHEDSGQTVPELLNRLGADGWELAGIQDFRGGGDGSSYWEASRLLTVYTFKRPWGSGAVPRRSEQVQVLSRTRRGLFVREPTNRAAALGDLG